MLSTVLSTAAQVLLLLLAVFVAWRATRAADDAQASALRAYKERLKVASLDGRVTTLESAHDSLQSAHRKLSGQFHQRKQVPDEVAKVDVDQQLDAFGSIDPDLEAMLGLQSAPPAKP
jgi:hypothetical protein